MRHYIADLPERKSGQHLQREERGAIQALKRQGLSNRAIAGELGCSPTTIGNELRRGTPPRKSSKGRAPGYSAKHGEAVYRSHRFRSRKPHKLLSCGAFVSWVAAQVREHKWSPDACTGYAKRHGLFQCNEMVCTHTLYHEAWVGNLPIGIMALPEVVKLYSLINNSMFHSIYNHYLKWMRTLSLMSLLFHRQRFALPFFKKNVKIMVAPGGGYFYNRNVKLRRPCADKGVL